MSAAAVAYDAIAASYDAQVAGDTWMRAALHRHYRRVFKTGDRVLDVGCGTGIDALMLAQTGIQVVGIDVSEAMVAQFNARMREAGLSDRAEAHVHSADKLDALGHDSFDGVISAFAGLSAVDDLSGFAAHIADGVKPHGRLVLHMLNRFSLWELLGYVGHARWNAARQVGRPRIRQFTIGGQPVPHRVYFADEVYRDYFGRWFTLKSAYALGALRPPHTVRRLPRAMVGGLEWLDVRTGGWPLLDHAGRFFVLDLERRPAST